jgi:hypothetical protein
MADDVFRPRKVDDDELKKAEAVRKALSDDEQESKPDAGSVEVKGNVPKEFLQALKMAQQSDPNVPLSEQVGAAAPKPFSSLKERPAGKGSKRFTNEAKQGPEIVRHDTHSGHLKDLLQQLKSSTYNYEEVQLPSKGKFYDGVNGPSNGILSIRQMTGEEEQILATPRFVRKGQAINMIFKRCMMENFQPENLLTADRTYLLIYLRGISYSNHYDVEVKCPECEKKFSADIDLASLYVEHCPDEFGPMLEDTLPTTGLVFHYRLSTGRDEQEITEYRDRRLKTYGDQAADDTLTHRTSMLLEDIDGITDKSELQILLKNLPINDVAHIRNCINEPPFGVDTNVEIFCPSCLQEFEMDLPLEANFFFPRKKKAENIQA